MNDNGLHLGRDRLLLGTATLTKVMMIYKSPDKMKRNVVWILLCYIKDHEYENTLVQPLEPS